MIFFLALSSYSLMLPHLPSSFFHHHHHQVRYDMYDHIGKFCTDSYYDFAGFKTGELFPRPVPNCTDSFIVINPKVGR
jgi:hypothetical protein